LYGHRNGERGGVGNTFPAFGAPGRRSHVSADPEKLIELIQYEPATAMVRPEPVLERAPKPAELFSRGAHDATSTFDIDNPNLTIETAKTVVRAE
jgi:hypothetical protein